MVTNQRNIIINDFIKEERSIITNARCLTEGVDVPAVDMVYFCDPKHSTVDIVQAIGRALRKNPTKDKKFAYIVLPIFHTKQDNVEEILESSHFKNLISVIKALSSHDQRIVDEITNLKAQKGQRVVVLESVSTSTEGLIYFDGYEETLQNKLFDEIINQIRLPWLPFEEARSYVHNLSLKSQKEWSFYRISGYRPTNIPSNPHRAYKNKGWKSYGDWLGNDGIANHCKPFLPFGEAKRYVHKLSLKSQKEWHAYCASGNRPKNIPSNPQQTYKDEGWKDWKDWLGTKQRQFLPFQEARSYVHKLSLKSVREWYAYCASGNRPKNIPSSPHEVYKDAGWTNYRDWLGTKHSKFLPFQEAKSYVHKLSLESRKEWNLYRASGNRPKNIPSNPHRAYKDKGWISWGDWLGKEKKQ